VLLLQGASAQAQTTDPVPVGQPPSTHGKPPEVAPIFEQPGVLTPRGHFVLEPSMQYSYASNNRVSVIGYTIIPAVVVGLVDIRQVLRSTVTAAFSARYGITNRLEVEARIPYVYRYDDVVSRPLATAATQDEVVYSARGSGIGDLEFGARYQLNDGGLDSPFYIGTLRFKTRTGRDPFEVVTDCVQNCSSSTATTGLPLELPTGSGFYSVQAGLTTLVPSDPAVFFGSLTYLYNVQRDNVSRNVLNGQQEFLGTIRPGAVLGFNIGMGLALNERSSFSVGYDHASVGPIKLNGDTLPGSVRSTLATLLVGYSYRLSNRSTMNFSIGAGLTTDTPGLTLTLRVPVTF